jgi:hypothetical protein
MILYYACDQTHFVRLTINMQDIIDYKIFWFSKMEYNIKDVLQAQEDLLGVLGFELEL